MRNKWDVGLSVKTKIVLLKREYIERCIKIKTKTNLLCKRMLKLLL